MLLTMQPRGGGSRPAARARWTAVRSNNGQSSRDLAGIVLGSSKESAKGGRRRRNGDKGGTPRISRREGPGSWEAKEEGNARWGQETNGNSRVGTHVRPTSGYKARVDDGRAGENRRGGLNRMDGKGRSSLNVQQL
ncbi:hypothetical protein NL676_007196 [Syzygium grande]|nr:hypothetical protein NL676_007196 [Syzygium grande]